MRGKLLRCVTLVSLVIGNQNERATYVWATDSDQVEARNKLILDVVLLDMLSEHERLLGLRLGSRELVVADTTIANPVVSNRFYRYFRDHGVNIPEAIGEDVRRRNTGATVSLHGYRPRSSRVRVGGASDEELSHGSGVIEFSAKYPKAVAYVKVSLPGYNAEGTRAVMLVKKGPSRHTWRGAYLLERLNGRWVVIAKHMAQRL
jgi:hypothetical protein